MKKLSFYMIMLYSLLAAHTDVTADEIDKIAAKVSEYINAGNYPKALEELAWYQKEVEKLHFARILDFFEEELAGYKRQQPKIQSTVRLSTVEAIYSNESEQIKAVLTGSSGGSVGTMGGLAALGHLAAMQGAAAGQDPFRLNGFTATLNHQRRRPELSIFLHSGWILKIVAPDAKTARSFANVFPTVELNEYLKGDK